MKAGLCLSIAVASATLVADHAAAQTTPAPPQQQAPAQQSPPPASDVVGPSELRDFSLGGEASRPAATPETGQADAPPATAAPRSRPATPQASPAPTPSDGAAASTAAPGPEGIAPATTGTFAQPVPSDVAPSILPPVPQPGIDPAPAGSIAPVPPNQSGSLWPWLLALAVVLLAAVALLVRQRARRTLAPVGPDPREAPQLGVADPISAPTPAPVPAPTAPGLAAGIVSTRLRPWIDLEFLPSRCIFDQERATVEFVLKVINTGNTDARDVLVETMLFNAGPEQDQEIGAFFAQPFAKGDAIPALPPNSGMELTSSVSLPADRLRVLEGGGRKFFVPLIGFTAIYRWGGGSGQTSRSYLLGREGQGSRMAPFRADLGPRVFRGLGAREHEVQVRR